MRSDASMLNLCNLMKFEIETNIKTRSSRARKIPTEIDLTEDEPLLKKVKPETETKIEEIDPLIVVDVGDHTKVGMKRFSFFIVQGVEKVDPAFVYFVGKVGVETLVHQVLQLHPGRSV